MVEDDEKAISKTASAGCGQKNRVFLIFQDFFCHLQMAKFLPSEMENVFHMIDKTSTAFVSIIFNSIHFWKIEKNILEKCARFSSTITQARKFIWVKCIWISFETLWNSKNICTIMCRSDFLRPKFDIEQMKRQRINCTLWYGPKISSSLLVSFLFSILREPIMGCNKCAKIVVEGATQKAFVWQLPCHAIPHLASSILFLCVIRW